MIEMGEEAGGDGPSSPRPEDVTSNNQHQHASAALLLDLAASECRASGDDQATSASRQAGLIHRQVSDPTGGGPTAVKHGFGVAAPSDHGALTSHSTAQPTQAHQSEQSTTFPPRFDEIGSPFVHVADYAAGKALRDNVLRPLLSEIGDTEEASLITMVDEYISGKRIRLERTNTIAQQKDGQCSKGSSIIEAQILPVSSRDAPIVALWYNTHGDKTLSYTSKAWSNWWIQRCGHPDDGCEMIKLITHEDTMKELILGIAYFERSVMDRHAVETDQAVKSDNDAESDESDLNAKARKRKRNESGDKQRTIHTTLLRGIRINPRFNPEVTRRLGLENGTSSAGSVRGIPAALVTYILAQSLRYGSEAVGVNCPKLDSAESFFEAMLGGCAQGKEMPEDDDGRKYFRLRGAHRWEVLRAAMDQQITLYGIPL